MQGKWIKCREQTIRIRSSGNRTAKNPDGIAAEVRTIQQRQQTNARTAMLGNIWGINDEMLAS
jgi:hypothetical protein